MGVDASGEHPLPPFGNCQFEIKHIVHFTERIASRFYCLVALRCDLHLAKPMAMPMMVKLIQTM
jgi:hypothetical protein